MYASKTLVARIQVTGASSRASTAKQRLKNRTGRRGVRLARTPVRQSGVSSTIKNTNGGHMPEKSTEVAPREQRLTRRESVRSGNSFGMLDRFANEMDRIF